MQLAKVQIFNLTSDKLLTYVRYIVKSDKLSQIRYSLVVILELNSVSEVQYKNMMIDR